VRQNTSARQHRSRNFNVSPRASCSQDRAVNSTCAVRNSRNSSPYQLNSYKRLHVTSRDTMTSGFCTWNLKLVQWAGIDNFQDYSAKTVKLTVLKINFLAWTSRTAWCISIIKIDKNLLKPTVPSKRKSLCQKILLLSGLTFKFTGLRWIWDSLESCAVDFCTFGVARQQAGGLCNLAGGRTTCSSMQATTLRHPNTTFWPSPYLCVFPLRTHVWIMREVFCL
jgi:hypothetical protein